MIECYLIIFAYTLVDACYRVYVLLVKPEIIYLYHRQTDISFICIDLLVLR